MTTRTRLSLRVTQETAWRMDIDHMVAAMQVHISNQVFCP